MHILYSAYLQVKLQPGFLFLNPRGEISRLYQSGPTSLGPRFPSFNFKLTLIEIWVDWRIDYYQDMIFCQDNHRAYSISDVIQQ